MRDMEANNRHQRRIVQIALTVVFSIVSMSALANKVYRWVDDKGKIHFNNSLPANVNDRPYQVFENGLLVTTVDPREKFSAEENAQSKQSASEEAAKKRDMLMRADRLLVLKYRNEQDILNSMETELANLDYDARLLVQSRDSVITAIRGHISDAADRQRAGMPVDAAKMTEIQGLRKRLNDGLKARDALTRRETQIRNLFMAELARFRFLSEGGAPGDPMPIGEAPVAEPAGEAQSAS